MSNLGNFSGREIFRENQKTTENIFTFYTSRVLQRMSDDVYKFVGYRKYFEYPKDTQSD